MRHYYQRVLFLISLAWVVVLSIGVYQGIITNLQSNHISDSILLKGILIFLVLEVFIVVFMFRFKRQSGLNWKAFMKSEIDQPDEDERAIQLDANIRRKSAGIISLMVIYYIIMYTMAFHQFTMTLLEIMVIAALLFTTYQIMNLVALKKAYQNDQLPSFLNRHLSSSLILFMIIATINLLMNTIIK